MDVLVKLTIPNTVYHFYKRASEHVAGCTPEDIMSDALSAYAGMISGIPEEQTSSSPQDAPSARMR